jgi:hypothetical protein
MLLTLAVLSQRWQYTARIISGRVLLQEWMAQKRRAGSISRPARVVLRRGRRVRLVAGGEDGVAVLGGAAGEGGLDGFEQRLRGVGAQLDRDARAGAGRLVHEVDD